VKTNHRILDLLVSQLRGLTATDAHRIIRNVIYDDGAIGSEDLNRAASNRYTLLDHNGALSCEFDTVDFIDMGGL
jgi:hypothetical protein